MRRIVFWVSAVALILASIAIAPEAAQAKRHGGIANGVVPPPSAPILNNVTITFGQQTQAFFGYGYLHAQDATSPSYTPFTYYGLGLMSPLGTPCAQWFQSYVSGAGSTHFQLSGGAGPVADASAITPVLDTPGAGHLTGDYVFQYSCTDANGHASNTATLTIHTVANTLNICTNDNVSAGGWGPTNFGSTPGARILLGVGCDFHNRQIMLKGVTLGGTNANRVTITVADASRPPYVSNFTTQNLSNIDVTGIMKTGNTDVGVNANSVDIFGSVYSGTPTSNETWENSTYYGSMLMYPSTGSNGNSSQSYFTTQCTTNCVAQNLQADFVAGGFIPSDGLTATNIDIGHFSNNCTAFNSFGSVNPAILTNISCHDPLTATSPGDGSTLHLDCMQSNDGATGENLTLNGFWCIQAGGSGRDNQGLWFGGYQMNSMGYIDDCAGGNGTKLTITSGLGFNSSSYGSRIWSPGNIAITDGVRAGQNGTGGGVTCQALLNISPTKIGSAGSPVPFANVGMFNFQADGIVDVGDTQHGVDSAGESGTSWFRHFAVVDQVPNPMPQVTFTGKIEGSVTSPYSGAVYASGITMTVSSALTPSSLSVLPQVFQHALTYSGCPSNPTNAYCSTSPTGNSVSPGLSIGGQGWSTEAVQATGTAHFTNGSTTMTISGPCTGRWDYQIAQGGKHSGMMVDGTGVPDYLYIIPALFLPSDGCAGNYTLNAAFTGSTGNYSVEGRPSNGRGNYGLYNYGSGATPTSAIAMAAWESVGLAPFSYQFYQQNCSNAYNHQGTWQVQYGYSHGGYNLCGAANTTTTNTTPAPVAADFVTGVLPETSLSATTAAQWDAMDVATGGSHDKKAYYCNKMLPALGGSLDLGGGNFRGPFTNSGFLQTASGNVAVSGCAGNP